MVGERRKDDFKQFKEKEQDNTLGNLLDDILNGRQNEIHSGAYDEILYIRHDETFDEHNEESDVNESEYNLCERLQINFCKILFKFWDGICFEFRDLKGIFFKILYDLDWNINYTDDDLKDRIRKEFIDLHKKDEEEGEDEYKFDYGNLWQSDFDNDDDRILKTFGWHLIYKTVTICPPIADLRRIYLDILNGFHEISDDELNIILYNRFRELEQEYFSYDSDWSDNSDFDM